MKWFTIMVLGGGLMLSSGCVTAGKSIPPHMTTVGMTSMRDMHCSRISSSGIHQLIFEKDTVGGPVTRYHVSTGRNNGTTFYKVRVWASTGNEKPEPGIYYRQFPGKVALTIE